MQSRLTPPTSHRKIVEDSSPISVWSHTNYVVTYTLKNFYLAFITVCTALTHREIFLVVSGEYINLHPTGLFSFHCRLVAEQANNRMQRLHIQSTRLNYTVLNLLSYYQINLVGAKSWHYFIIMDRSSIFRRHYKIPDLPNVG